MTTTLPNASNTRFVATLALTLLWLIPLPAAALASIDNPSIDNWKPLVAFAGDGDNQKAIQRLREIDQLQSTMVNNTQYDDQTETFINKMWNLIESFNLQKLHETLPVSHQDWNQLSLKGEQNDNAYNITMNHNKSLNNVQVTDFGDSYLMFKTQEISQNKGPTHYLIENNIKTGFGAQSWQSIRNASNETVQLISFMDEHPAPINNNLKDSMLPLSQNLGASDIDVLSSAWSSFPNVWKFMSSIGHINDIIVEEKSTETVKHVNLSFSINKEKTAEQYPALTDYLDKLQDLLETSFEVINEHGTLLTINVDSTTATANVAFVAGKGGIYPVKNKKPVLDHIHTLAEKPVTLVGIVNSNLQILGVKTKISNLVSTIQYTPEADSARVEMKINKTPHVEVGGAALGFIPTPMIDLFMPSNLKGIIDAFFDVACNGNNGNGIVTNVEIKNINTEEKTRFTQLSANTRFETFSNLFVRIGMNIVNSRLIPSTSASQDIDLFIDNARKAFNSDVDLFEQSIKQQHASHSVALR